MHPNADPRKRLVGRARLAASFEAMRGGRVSGAWDDEGFGGENDSGEESVEADVEEESLFEPVEVEEEEDDFDADGEQ